MKKLLFLLFSFISFFSFAQLDREHWFAPMFDGQSNGGDEQFLQVSTNETTPFKVYVYNNNLVVTTLTISKGNPGVYNVPRSYIITTSTFDLFKVRTLGLYIKADKPCFANLRFGVTNHTEIITSKGTAGIGTKFYTVVAPNTYYSTNTGFAASFLATEDNTTVTVNNFKKLLTFNGAGSSTSFTFTLNKGQSYIIDGRSNATNNYDGFIGATVTADKPISMSNGNFNGQYATTNSGAGTDILMDQSVPVDKLGDEFVIVKGYGQIGNNMEGAIVVATEKNTQVFVNDSPTPIATLANEGDYYFIKENNYILRGGTHFNMHIKSDKNIYVYQVLGGVESGSSPLATGGMNYIPPLNCYLPKRIDEISYINYLSNVPHSPPFQTKLNIITEKGAAVTVNGTTPNPLYGPYDISSVAANQKWVSYSIPNVTGNITVVSTKAVTAGIASGNGAFGYGGYFAGFSAIPLILKVDGNCLPGVTLAVTAGYDSYEWLLKNPDGSYSPAPGINNTFSYDPPQAGIYAVKVKQGSCPEIQTKDYKFYNCTTYTNQNIPSCGNETLTPFFALSSQTVNPATITLTTPPTKGTVTITPTGQVIYTANPNVSGTDTFKISFCGIGVIPDCETIQYSIQMIEKNDNQVLQECSTNGIATYNLTTANVTPDTTLTKSYFKTFSGAQNNIAADQILNFTNYSSADGFIYVRLVNGAGCVSVAKVELKSKLAPEVKENLYTKLHCDEDLDGVMDGIYKVNVSTITPIVLVQASNFVVRYYPDAASANVGGANNITGTYSFSAGGSIWIRVDAPNGCPSVIKEIILQTGSAFTITDPVTEYKCDNDQNNSENILLSDYTSKFTTDPGATVQFFNTLANAKNNTPTTTDAQTIAGPRSFFYRFKKAGFCDVIGTLNISLKPSTPTALLNSYTVCQGETITLTAEDSPTYVAWLWMQGATTISNTKTATLSSGTYTVSFTDASGCIFTKNITVVDSPKPILNIAAYNATLCDSNFDGISDPVNFNTVTPIIVTNYAANSTLFNVRYYLNKNDRDAGNSNTIPNLTNWTFTAPTIVYVRAESQYCAYIPEEIHFGFGVSVPLIKTSDTRTVCDDNTMNGSEVVNLANYRTIFTADGTASVKYFDDMVKAQNNLPGQNIAASQTISGDKTFYYRFSKAGFCDVIGTLNLLFKSPTPTALLNSYTICAGSTILLTAEPSPTYTAWLWKKGSVTVSTTNTATLGAGVYTVTFTNASGCDFTKTITVVDSPKPILNIAAYNATLCDSNFDGISDPVNFNTVTPIIVTNYAANSTLFNVRYYLNKNDRDAGNSNTIPNLTNWTFTAPTIVYVRAESQYCAYIPEEIHFGFGVSVPLIKTSDTRTVCDDNTMNGSEVVNLANYRTIFTADGTASVKYFDDMVKAQNNLPGQNIAASQTISGDKTFYYRFSKAGFCDVIGTLNLLFKSPTPTALLNSYTICAGSTILLTAEPSPTYTTWLWKKGTATVSTTNTATLGAGTYTITFTNASGCPFTKTITILESPKPVWKLNLFSGVKCDENFDGQIDVNLNDITPVIIGNSSLFTVHYYLNQNDANVGNNNYIQNPATWSYTTNTTIWVRAFSQYCPGEVKQLDFKKGNDIPVSKTEDSVTECDNADNNEDGIKTVNLGSYISNFTALSGVTATYYDNLNAAQNSGTVIPNPVSVNQSGVYYLRLHKANYCDVIVKLNVTIQIPKKSTVLKDKAICPGTITQLDAGPGFDSYLWSTGETTQTIDVPVGNYWVDLTFNGCTFRQHVTVSSVPMPTITGVEIMGTTVTVNVSGGNPPYQYAIDNGNYQSSNVFHNVRGGDHTIYVISSDNCAPVSYEITVVEPYNVITPNADGINDVLNYSALLKKDAPFMQIFDRYGKIVFVGDKNNRYTWDGRAFGKAVPTGSYWLVMHWTEPGVATPSQYSGWVLVKNRD